MLPRVLQFLLLVGMLVVGQGCVRVAPTHPWTVRPSLPVTGRSWWSGVRGQAPEVVAQWEEVPQERISLVKEERVKDARERLRERSFVGLTQEERSGWADDLKETSPTLQAYLVRGLGYGRDWARVSVQKETGEVWVQQGFWVSFPRTGKRLGELPVVVMLEKAPAKVAVTAHRGGDELVGADPRFRTEKTRASGKAIAFWLLECDYPVIPLY